MAYPWVTTAPAAATVGGETSQTQTHPILLPALVPAGDLLLILFVNDGVTTHSGTPSGFSSLGTQTFGTGDNSSLRFTVYGKVATGSEGGTTVNVTTSQSENSAWVAYRLINHYGGLGTDAIQVAFATGSGNDAPDPPNIAPGWGTGDICWIAAAGWDGAKSISTYPSTHTASRRTQAGVGTGGCGIAVATEYVAGSARDAGAFAISGNDEWIAASVAVRPRAADAYPQLHCWDQIGVNADTTSHNYLIPSTDNPPIISGEIIVGVIANDGSTTVQGTPPDTQLTPSSEARLTVKELVSGFSQVTLNADEKCATLALRFVNVRGTYPESVSVGGGANGTSANPDPGSFAPSHGSDNVLWIAACAWDNGTASATDYPSGYDRRATFRHNAADAVGVATAQIKATAASQDPGTFTLSASQPWAALTIAVRGPSTGPQTQVIVIQ